MTVLGFLGLITIFLAGTALLKQEALFPKEEFTWPVASEPSGYVEPEEPEQPREDPPVTVLYEYYQPMEFQASSFSSDIPEPLWMNDFVRSRSSQSSWASSSFYLPYSSSQSAGVSSSVWSSNSSANYRPRPRTNLSPCNSTQGGTCSSSSWN